MCSFNSSSTVNATLCSIRKYEPFDWYTMLQSLYGVLDHQLQDGLMSKQESDCMLFAMRKLWDLKLQIHMIEKEDEQLTDVIGHITLMLEIVVCLRVYTRCRD